MGSPAALLDLALSDLESSRSVTFLPLASEKKNRFRAYIAVER